MNNTTQQIDGKEIKQAVNDILIVLSALTEAIQIATLESHLKGIPSGHLYSMVMHKIELPLYQKLIKILIDAKQVNEFNHLLTWIGSYPVNMKKGLTNDTVNVNR